MNDHDNNTDEQENSINSKSMKRRRKAVGAFLLVAIPAGLAAHLAFTDPESRPTQTAEPHNPYTHYVTAGMGQVEWDYFSGAKNRVAKSEVVMPREAKCITTTNDEPTGRVAILEDWFGKEFKMIAPVGTLRPLPAGAQCDSGGYYRPNRTP